MEENRCKSIPLKKKKIRYKNKILLTSFHRNILPFRGEHENLEESKQRGEKLAKNRWRHAACQMSDTTR